MTKRMACGVLAGALLVGAGARAAPGDWTYFGGSHRFDRYAPLAQIDAGNVTRIAVAWIRKGTDQSLLDRFPDLSPSNYLRGTPVMVDGVLYAPDAVGLVEAFDPASGKTLWVQQPVAPTLKEAAGQSTRGIDVWGTGAARRIMVVRGEYLIALDAATGAPVSGFGEAGRVLLRRDTPDKAPFFEFNGPIVVGDVVVIGGNGGGMAGGGYADGGNIKESTPEDIRGYDARSGKLVWTFHLSPTSGPFAGTWGGAEKFTGNMAAWAPIAADDAAGIVYVPTSAPTNSYFGGHRPGANLFSDSLIAIDAKTGAYRWHFQMVHHDLWDYDNASAPVLADITVGGKPVKAVIQANKTGMVFVFDRLTGKPVWPIVERAVPQSDVPGEHTSPTQPFPTRPAPMDHQGIAEADLIDFTPALHDEAKAIFAQYATGPLFTPPIVVGSGGKQATMAAPSVWGTANWNTGAFDPETQTYYAASMTMPGPYGLVKSTKPEDTIAYQGGDVALFRTFKRHDYGYGPRGLPLTKPPYGRVTAYDMGQGAVKWIAATGDGPRNVPDLKPLNLPPLGNIGRSTTLVTKTLLFVADAGDAGFGSFKPVNPPMLRAFDKASGRLIAEIALPAGATGGPISYAVGGHQMIVVPIGGKAWGSGWIAFGAAGVIRAFALLALAAPAAADPPAAPAGDPLYAQVCAGCHGATMLGGGQGPALVGAAFMANWAGLPARRLYARVISTMPASNPGSLDPDQALALTLLVLRANGAAPAVPVASPDALGSLPIQPQ